MDNNEIEIDIRELGVLLFHKAGIILLSGLFLAFVSIVYTKVFVTPMYQSVTKMYVLTQQNSSAITSSDLTASAYLTKDYVELITSRTVLEDVIEQFDLDVSYEKFLNRVTVSTMNDTRVVAIFVLDEDAYRAQELADAVRVSASARIKEVMNIEAVNVVDKANLPDDIHSPNVMRNGMIAGILGMCLAIGVVSLQHFMNDRIVDAEDVAKYLDLCVLGSIPLEKDVQKKKTMMKRGVWRWWKSK